MAKEQLRPLTIEFLEDKADGLRLVTQPNLSVRCFVADRSVLPNTLSNATSRGHLDVPGVYLLMGPPEKADDSSGHDSRLYVGQADSVADRLDSHLRSDSKRWWRTVLVITRDRSPLNLTLCRLLESRLCELASKASSSVLMNRNAPQPPNLTSSELSVGEDFLDKALVIVSAQGFNFFEPSVDNGPEPPETPGTPRVPQNLEPLLEEIRQMVTGPTFPETGWYWTRSPDYRAKVKSGSDLSSFH